MPPAQPTPKYLAISREIETKIRSGTWPGGKIPSSRNIAGSHKVSLVTASRAIQVLRDKGLIQTVNRSGSFLTAGAAGPGDAAARERWALCLHVTPGPWQQASLSVTRGGFVAAAAQDGVNLETGLFAFRDGAGPADFARQAQAAAGAGVAGVFLVPSRVSDEAAAVNERLLAACRSEGMAAVLVERNLHGAARPLEHDLVATDDLEGGRLSAQHLLDRGCRRVAFVTGSPTSSHEGRLAGYLAAMFHASAGGGGAYQPLVLEQRADLPTKAAYRDLAGRLLAAEADGVVCYQDYTAIGLIMELLTRGRRVPRDLAITGFDDLPIGDTFALGVTTYAFPAAAIARQAFHVIRRRLREPDAPPAKVVIPGTLIVRDSSGPG